MGRAESGPHLQRRTYAVTGDRIELDFTINDRPMGSELVQTADRQIDVAVIAPDSIKMIELVRNGHVIKRHFPEDTAVRPAPLPGQVNCRLRLQYIEAMSCSG